MYLWRAVDGEGEVLDVLVQKRRNKRAALKLLRKSLQTQGITPTKIVTDKLRSYGAALRDLEIEQKVPMFPFGDGNERCKDLSFINLLRFFFQVTVPFIISSTHKDISFQDRHYEHYGQLQ